MRAISYELRLAPLAIALIVLTTAIPIESRGFATGWSVAFGTTDILQNLLLYAPLGAALCRWPLWRTAAAAAAISLMIETTQLWQLSRFASPVDLATNTMGAVGGAIIYRYVRRPPSSPPVTIQVTLGRALAAVALLLLALGFGVGFRADRGAYGLATWDTSYPLLLGNERTSDRPWRGEIKSLQLMTSTWTPGSVPAGVVYESTTPILLDGGPARELGTDVSRRFADGAVSTHSFSVLARLTTAETRQYGPARILSFSVDTLHRNFDLGQAGSHVVFRVRTGTTGLNGEASRTEARLVLLTGREVEIAATFDGSVVRLYENGKLASRGNLAATACRIRALCDVAAPAVWAVAGGAMMLLALLVVPIATPARFMIAVAIAGSAAIGLAFLLSVQVALVGVLKLSPVLGYVGAAMVGAARHDIIERMDWRKFRSERSR